MANAKNNELLKTTFSTSSMDSSGGEDSLVSGSSASSGCMETNFSGAELVSNFDSSFGGSGLDSWSEAGTGTNSVDVSFSELDSEMEVSFVDDGLQSNNSSSVETCLTQTDTTGMEDVPVTFHSMMEALQSGTQKHQSLLLDECDIIMECRKCRTIFRTADDLVSHKESDCVEMLGEGEVANAMQSRSEKNCNAYDKVWTTGIPKDDAAAITVCLKPLLERNDGSVILKQEVVSLDSFGQTLKSWEINKQDTVVLGLDGKVIGTGTLNEMQVIASGVGAEMESLLREGIHVEPPNQNMCGICSKEFRSRTALRAHSAWCPSPRSKKRVKRRLPSRS